MIYRLYTISDLNDWLFHNVDNGLTDAVISRPRALAFVSNPHAHMNDAALAVVFNEREEPVGYTGAFAEHWVRPLCLERYFWGSTQWMDVQYRGKGVSAKMMRQIKDAVADRYVALESSVASCRLDEKQGSIISYYPRYFIILEQEPKSVRLLIKNVVSGLRKRKALKELEKYDYINQYVAWIDDETYSFIVNHSDKDLFLRKQDFLNWQMYYPFAVAIGNDNRVDVEQCEFGGRVRKLQTLMVQVYAEGRLCGFYVLRVIDSVCTTWYLYYDDAFREQVFASVAAVLLQLNDITKFSTFNKDLFDFMKHVGIRSQFSKSYIENVSLTVPGGFEVDGSLRIQGADGDMMR